MTLHNASRFSILLLGFLALPTVTHGQTSNQDLRGCEVFASCALRVRYRLFRTEIVRGTESTHVARIGFGAPPLDELLSRSDRSAVSFDRFRQDHTKSSWLAVLGGLEIVGGLVARAQDNEDWAIGLSISGVVIEIAAVIFRTRANEHLSEAMWWYNESLAKGEVRQAQE
jgi:hypothetical protein